MRSRPRLIALTLSGALAGAMALSAAGGRATAQPAGLDIARTLDDLIARAPEDAFPPLAGPWRLDLPRDHGAHDDARIETWTVAAHLRDAHGTPVGAHVALMRVGLRAAAADDPPWELRALHRAHVVVVDGDGARAEERFSRGGAGVAGHAWGGDGGEVWLDHWSLAYGDGGGIGGGDGGGLGLSVSVGGEPLTLRLTPEKTARTAGGGDAPVRGFALTRMRVEGSLGRGARARTVSGLAWLDRLWGEVPLPGGPVAYDRLLAHLDDGSDLSVLRTRRRGRDRDRTTVEGALIAPDGTARTLGEGLAVEPLRRWRSGDIAYPVAWRLAGGGLDLEVRPVLDAQAHAFALPVWNGLVRVTGARDGHPVTGLGTLQLTGYAP